MVATGSLLRKQPVGAGRLVRGQPMVDLRGEVGLGFLRGQPVVPACRASYAGAVYRLRIDGIWVLGRFTAAPLSRAAAPISSWLLRGAVGLRFPPADGCRRPLAIFGFPHEPPEIPRNNPGPAVVLVHFPQDEG